MEKVKKTQTHLESSHVARISSILEAVLIAFEEEFEEESVREEKKRGGEGGGMYDYSE